MVFVSFLFFFVGRKCHDHYAVRFYRPSDLPWASSLIFCWDREFWNLDLELNRFLLCLWAISQIIFFAQVVGVEPTFSGLEPDVLNHWSLHLHFLCGRLVLTQFLWFFRPAQYTSLAPAAYFLINTVNIRTLFCHSKKEALIFKSGLLVICNLFYIAYIWPW